MRAHSPLSGSSVNESCAQDTAQKHGKHFLSSTVFSVGPIWVQKELRDSQYRGCTVAYKENNVYNIYMKPRENKIDAMPLSGDSESGGCRLGPNL